MTRKLILKSSLSPGDIVLLTAAVRDLHLTYPNRFLTDVRTSCPELWENNPYLTALSEKDPKASLIECEYPLIDESNRAPFHAIHGFAAFLSQRISHPFRPLFFRGDIHLSSAEKSWYSQVHELRGEDIPFWIVSAGGKYDCTIKWWDVRRYQAVIDHFQGKIQFVQVGAVGHYHPALRGVIDLRGQTNLRQLVRLIYHAQGVLCGVTSLMHLAAAIETRPDRAAERACVVVAGGREPPHWEAYPHHQFLHTVGALPCCAQGGCWRARTRPLKDGEEFDRPENLCVDVVEDLPRCMHLISAAEVIRKIELYREGGSFDYLPARRTKAGLKVLKLRSKVDGYADIITPNTAQARLEASMKHLPVYPGGYAGRGVVICGGGVKYFPPAWVCVNQLRRLGCRLPIQLWYLGKSELDLEMKRLLARLDVECVDAEIVRQRHPMRILRGWELKAFALTYCPFRDVLLLDSDNLPLVNPEFLFDTPPYRGSGAVFWPDVRFYQRKHPVWRITGIPFRPGREFESGQILLNKQRCWRPLRLALWINEHSDFFYRYILGDKDTFYLAFRKLRQAYSMPQKPVRRLAGTMCQHDFRGNRIFQHRNTNKWNIWLQNPKVKGFRYDAECRFFLRQLQEQWDGGMASFTRELGASSVWASSAPTNRPPQLAALVFSTPALAWVHRRTLNRLRRTDWKADLTGIVCMLPGTHDSLWQSAHRLLRSWGGRHVDYLLLLGHDLRFNSFLWQNLVTWEPLRRRQPVIASLSYPGIPADACDIANQCYVARADAGHQSHAFVISRQSFDYLLNHWTDDDQHQPEPLVARVAAKLQQPVLYHSPSLAKSLTARDLFLGESSAAEDYKSGWRRSVEQPQAQLEGRRGPS